MKFGILSEIESFTSLFLHWWDMFLLIKVWDLVMVIRRMGLIAVEIRCFVRFAGRSPFA